MKILQKNKTKKNKTRKNKTRKNKLLKGGEYMIEEPEESMKHIIIHKDYKNPKTKDKKNKCVPQQANTSKEVDSSHNYCEIDDLIASVLGRLLKTLVYSKDKTLADDSSSGNSPFSFLKNLSHIPLSFFESKTNTSGKQFAKKMYLNIETIKKTLEDIQNEGLNKIHKSYDIANLLDLRWNVKVYEYKFFPTNNTTATPKIEINTLTKGVASEPLGFHLPPLKPKKLNEIIENNFKIMDNDWIENHKDYNAIIDGLNISGGGGDYGITDLKTNLENLFKEIKKIKKTSILKKILVVYRGAIAHSHVRYSIQKTINNIIKSMEHKNVTIDVMYVHTSITDSNSKFQFQQQVYAQDQNQF
jgi:hypothetical protein